MDFEAPAAESAKKRAKSAAKPKIEGKRTTSRGKELPEGVTRIKPFEDLEAVASEGMAPGARRKESEKEVREALEMVRETAEESAWDAKIAEAKAGLEEEEAWNAKISEAKSRPEIPKIPAAKDRRVLPPPEVTDVPEYEEMTVESAPQKAKMRIPAIPPESEASRKEHAKRSAEEAEHEKEEAWFKKGEDPEHVKALAERQHEEEGRKIEDVRRQISESYDKGSGETILDTDREVEAAAKQAEAMVASGRLNAEMFNAKDYRYLLVQQARIDNELESAGWWAARKLRSEMKEIRKELDGYESQIQGAMSERAPSGELTAKEKEDIRYKGPMAKPALPQGSGTTVHKKGFFSRLFGKK